MCVYIYICTFYILFSYITLINNTVLIPLEVVCFLCIVHKVGKCLVVPLL